MFITLEGLSEPIVIFFGFTNLLVTFQTIMNEILKNLINTGEVVSFIDNIIVEMEEEEEYNKVVEEVVKKLAEYNLYMKPEKYKWKVKKVGFLKVVIRLKRTMIEKEKIKTVLNYSTSKGVKNIQKFLELANYYR